MEEQKDKITVLLRRKTIFYLTAAALLIVLLEGLGAVLLGFYSRGADFENMRNYNKIRKLLLGKALPAELPRFSGQAYLNYTMTPGFEENGIKNINSAGFRGHEVSLEKDSNVLRILFLGGSTTYSSSVSENDKTYPAVCGKLISDYLHTAGGRYKKAEVINGGLLWATSFEMLGHYLYKFRYYKADIVVVHEGGNDAQAYTFNKGNYTPDYSHWRKNMDDIKPLKGPARFLLHSRLLSFFIIRLFYNETEQNLFVHFKPELKSQWFNPAQPFEPFSGKNNAFLNNMKSLSREVVADKSSLVLVPFIFNPNHEQNLSDSIYAKGIAAHNDWMRQLADSTGGRFVALKNSDISKQSYWTDDCHLNEHGEAEKANIVAAAIIRQLQMVK